MHLSVLVVSKRVLLDGFENEFVGDDDVGLTCCFCCLDGEFEDIEKFAGIASTLAQESTRFLQFNLFVFEKNIFCERIVEQFQQVVFTQRFQHIDLAAGEERTNYLERRILRCGTNEGDNSLLHSTEK